MCFSKVCPNVFQQSLLTKIGAQLLAKFADKKWGPVVVQQKVEPRHCSAKFSDKKWSIKVC